MPLDPHPLAGLVPEMTHEEFDLLVADIHEHGLLTPIVLFEDRILDGRHRYRAIQDIAERGTVLRPRFEEFCGSHAEAASRVVSLNIHRRHLTTGQRAMIAVPLEESISESVKPGNPHRDDETGQFTISGNIAGNGTGSESRDIAAAAVNVSPRSVQAAKKLCEEAPHIAEQVRNGHLDLWQGVSLANKEQREAAHATKLAQPLPTGKYRTIVIDPPWPMAQIERNVRPNQPDVLEYPVMSLAEIGNLPVHDWAAGDGAHVYLWTTQKFLPTAFGLFEQWGVAYECLLTWLKPGGITPYSWQYNTEHCLFGRIGSLQLSQLGIKIGFEAPRDGHSVKPDYFYEIVCQASPEPRLEAFARAGRDGFQAWGNEGV